MRQLIIFILLGTLVAACSKSDGKEDSPPTASETGGSCNAIVNDVQSYCYDYAGFSTAYVASTLKPRCTELSAGKPVTQIATSWSSAVCRTQGKVAGCRMLPIEGEASGTVVVWYYDATVWASAIAGCPADKVIQP